MGGACHSEQSRSSMGKRGKRGEFRKSSSQAAARDSMSAIPEDERQDLLEPPCGNSEAGSSNSSRVRKEGSKGKGRSQGKASMAHYAKAAGASAGRASNKPKAPAA